MRDWQGGQDEKKLDSDGISLFEAAIHKFRGNLGPGALALPSAVSAVGPYVGILGLLFVCIPGIYGMVTLVDLKRQLVFRGHNVATFEDVACLAFGRHGRKLLEWTILFLQLGVCVVYIGVISTAACALPHLSMQCTADGQPDFFVILLVSLTLVLPLSMLRKIASLMPLSVPGNIAILSAVLGSSSKAIYTLQVADIQMNGTAHMSSSDFAATTNVQLWPSSIKDVFIYLGAVFYAFEGIALVLPIENALSSSASDPRSRFGYKSTLIASLSCAVSLFALVGITCGLAFPDAGGSIVAYLTRRYPESSSFFILNLCVAAAVLFTFPLQLAPAMPTLESYCCSPKRPLFAQPASWVLTRFIVVLSCAAIIGLFRDVKLLIGFVGSITTTIVGAFPFCMALSLSKCRLIRRMGVFKSTIAALIICFNLCVMILGTSSSAKKLLSVIYGKI